MKLVITLGACLLSLAWVYEPDEVTTSDVMTLIHEVPVLHGTHPGGFGRGLGAREIAEAIAEKADGSILGSKTADAALLVVFGCYESGLHNYASGDGGKSRGFLQLGEDVPPGVAYNPRLAIDAWKAKAKASLEACKENPDDQRLAAVASGNCIDGRALVQERVHLAWRLALGWYQ